MKYAQVTIYLFVYSYKTKVLYRKFFKFYYFYYQTKKMTEKFSVLLKYFPDMPVNGLKINSERF